MADFAEIIKSHCGEDGAVPADAIAKLAKAISTTVGNEFVEKSRYKAKLEEIDTLKADKQTAEDSATTASKWKDKHDSLKKEFEAYKADIAAKESRSAKESAARAYYESKGIAGKSLEIAMRGSAAEVGALELGDDGKIKDAAALDALVKGDFSGLVSSTTTQGADTPHPPANSGTGVTKADIYKKDGKGRYLLSASERQKALMENQIM